MIVYEPNKNFLKDISHLAKSWTMIKIMRSVLAVGVYAAAIIIPLEYFELSEKLTLNPSIFSLLGVVLSILLVFRTNSAYERWWEGRKQWGALVNHSRNLAITTRTTFDKDNQADRHQMAVYISNFCIAFKEHLRDGVKVDELIFLSEEDKKTYANKSHIPNHISYQIHQLVQDAYKRGEITGEDLLNFKPQMQALLDILGACERIKKTPIPFSYAVYIKIFILAYALVMPIALDSTFHLLSIPLTMFVFFAFIGIELMAEEIEMPFGLDCNNLPTGTIAHNIKENAFEILEAKKGHKEVRELYQKVF